MAKKAARGRAKLAAKEAAAKAQASADVSLAENRAGKVSAKTKKKVANKVQFLQKVQESAASTSRRKAKTAKRKGGANKPLNNLAGLNEALQDLMPMVQSQAQVKFKDNANAPKFKCSGARSNLQLQAQEDIAAVLQAKEFQADPIKALTTHLQLFMGPAPEPNRPSKATSKQEKKRRARLKQHALDMEIS